MSVDEAQLDRVFAALANKHRRAIVHHLSLQPASISELAKELKLSLPAIHKHIAVLEEAGFLQRKKSGRSNFLAFNRAALLLLHRYSAQYYTYWGSDAESLESYVSGIERRGN